MSSFVTDPTWQKLQNRLRQGMIAPGDAEWALA